MVLTHIQRFGMPVDGEVGACNEIITTCRGCVVYQVRQTKEDVRGLRSLCRRSRHETWPYADATEKGLVRFSFIFEGDALMYVFLVSGLSALVE